LTIHVLLCGVYWLYVDIKIGITAAYHTLFDVFLRSGSNLQISCCNVAKSFKKLDKKEVNRFSSAVRTNSQKFEWSEAKGDWSKVWRYISAYGP